MSSDDALLRCDNLEKDYLEASSPVTVLKGVTFELKRGEMLGIIGASGSGKSTLLHILGALDSPSRGDVVFDGRSIFSMDASQQASYRNQALGFVYQFHHLLSEFSALENVAMPLLIAGEKRASAMAKARDMLANVGLSNREAHRPAQLSGGERQRVAIARALVNEPDIVLADEPTGNLDQETGEEILSLLIDLRQRLSTSFIVVTHDVMLAKRLDRVMAMKRGHLETFNA